MLFELNEVAALEGLKMSQENFSRMQLIQANLLRAWGDKPRRSCRRHCEGSEAIQMTLLDCRVASQ